MTYRPRVCGVWPALSGCGRGGSVDRPTCTVSLSGRGLTGRQPRVTRLGRNRGPTRSTELIVEEDDQERHDVKSRYPDLPIFDLRQPHHQQQPAKTSHRREGIGDAAEGQQDNVPPWSRPPRRVSIMAATSASSATIPQVEHVAKARSRGGSRTSGGSVSSAPCGSGTTASRFASRRGRFERDHNVWVPPPDYCAVPQLLL